SGLDRALANVLTPASERRGERSPNDGHGRIVDLDSLVASSSRVLSVLPEVFTPNGAVRFNDEPVADIAHDLTFESASVGFAFTPEMLDVAADVRNDRFTHSVSSGHALESAASLPAFARTTSEFMSEVRVAIEEHNRIVEIAESTHRSPGTEAAPPPPDALDLSAFSEAAVRIASGSDIAGHGVISTASPLDLLLAPTHFNTDVRPGGDHSGVSVASPLNRDERSVNDDTRPGAFSDPRGLFTPTADVLARTIVEPLDISVEAEEVRSEPARAASEPAGHSVPSWVSSMPTTNFGMNITPMAPRPVVPAPPARKAAFVVTGQTTLNVAPTARSRQQNFCDSS